MAKLPGTHLLLGDLNLGWNLPEKLTSWKTLGIKKTYPSWKPAIQFDYIMGKEELDYSQISLAKMAISDHLPLAVEIKKLGQ
jgi:endonuclease/exonuclease/phosphatase family metal-dependent hydrolase